MIEAPDDAHTDDFGRHITEIYDNDLKKYVFKFHSHLAIDNDPATQKSDRQRVEIKTYRQSPNHLKATRGEIVRYKWLFKIPAGFLPTQRFTHIHQIKAVDGDAGKPLFTLTLRAGTPNKLELLHDSGSESKAVKLVTVPMSLFEDTWVEATETITVGANGTYAIEIKKVSDKTVLLSYDNENIETIREDNTFIRPKWGIYRDITNASKMKDETLLFSDFSIEELKSDK